MTELTSKNQTPEEYRRKNQIREFSRRHFFRIKPINWCENCGIKKELIIHHSKYTFNPADWHLLCVRCHKKEHFETHPFKILEASKQ